MLMTNSALAVALAVQGIGFNVNTIITLFTGLGFGGIAVAFINYMKDRHKVRDDHELAERTRAANVALTDISAVQAKVATLEKIVDAVSAQNERLTKDNLEIEARERSLRQRVRELEDEMFALQRKLRETQMQYDILSEKLVRLNAEIGGNNA